MERIRLFIGTRVPENVAPLIRNAADQQLAQPMWRVAPEQQWHVTALFVGERPAKDLLGIKDAVERIASDSTQIQLQKGRLLTMPEQGPTMLWVRFDPHTELTRLHHRLAQALAMRPSHHVPYWPHITLARSRGRITAQIDGPPLVKELMLSELTLFRSERSDHGSVHTAMGSWPLSGTGPIGPVAVG